MGTFERLTKTSRHVLIENLGQVVVGHVLLCFSSQAVDLDLEFVSHALILGKLIEGSIDIDVIVRHDLNPRFLVA